MLINTAVRPQLEPRGLSKEDAAAYCGVSPSCFAAWVSKGLMPKSIIGTHRWDKKAIDRALDAVSGLKPDEPEDPYLAWKRSQDARRA